MAKKKQIAQAIKQMDKIKKKQTMVMAMENMTIQDKVTNMVYTKTVMN